MVEIYDAKTVNGLKADIVKLKEELAQLKEERVSTNFVRMKQDIDKHGAVVKPGLS